MLRKDLTNRTMKSKEHYPYVKKIGLMKDNLSGRIIKELRPKMYSYVTGHVCVEKKAKGIKKCVI